jgi:hypothetical protein
MPDLNTHFNNAYIFITGALGALVSFGFDVQPATLWVALFGASMGLAFKPPINPWKGFALIICVAAAVGWLLPFATHHLEYPPKSLSFVISLMLVATRHLLPKKLEETVDAFFARVGTLISFWTPKP